MQFISNSGPISFLFRTEFDNVVIVACVKFQVKILTGTISTANFLYIKLNGFLLYKRRHQRCEIG